ncbi:Dabb family protein [Actinomyces minihominis]|uniref:Dabb family protein n=1 Tax=Actinomyces minihominis TaxID=2002838 RepID=UPI000C06DADE|nr:Dabb family protein [Actinomyces minihominis]
MLRHVVMWKISADKLGSNAVREDVAERLSAELRALVGVVPGIIDLQAGPNCMNDEENWDFGLVVDFEDEEALRNYAVHPAHLEVVKQIRAVVSARVAVDFKF